MKTAKERRQPVLCPDMYRFQVPACSSSNLGSFRLVAFAFTLVENIDLHVKPCDLQAVCFFWLKINARCSKFGRGF